MKKRNIVLSFVAVAVAGYMFYRFVLVSEEVRTIPVIRGNLTTIIYATGTVTADTAATLRCETGGNVVMVGGREGMEVRKGHLLVRTQQEDEHLRVRQAETELQAAQLEWEDREKNRKRQEDLLRAGSSTQKELDDAAFLCSVAANDVQRRKIALDIARRNLAKTEVLAPFDGILVGVDAGIGDNLPPNSICATIVAPQSILVRGEVDEQDLAGIRAGQSAIVAFDAFKGEKFAAVVHRIVPRTDEATKTSHVFLRLPQRPSPLHLGMTATINIIAGEKRNVLLLPRTSVLQRGERTVVFLVRDNRLREIGVNAGVSDSRYLEAGEDSLAAGDRIVSQPKASYKTGMSVRPVGE